MNKIRPILSILSSLCFTQLTTLAKDTAPSLRAVKIIEGLDSPVFLTAPDKSTDALYILEKAGRIMIYDRKAKKILPKPFLDISKQIKIKMNEQGLLGMAFSPNYQTDHRFYLYYTNTKGDTQVSRFTHQPNGKAINEEKLITVAQDFKNHNGGWIGFGPENYLFIALGDGGSRNDPKKRAQDKSQHLGKLLRIDVSGDNGYTVPKDNPFLSDPSALKEIYAYGLRNPWRCSWDLKTNQFYIADVGQNQSEEINALNNNKLKGANFGWRAREATKPTPTKSVGGPKQHDAVDPIFEYKHSIGRSITGGYVYRGKIKSIQGHYFYADWVMPKIWSIVYDGNKVTSTHDWTDQFSQGEQNISLISSFGTDPQGEIYIISHKGDIFYIEK